MKGFKTEDTSASCCATPNKSPSSRLPARATRNRLLMAGSAVVVGGLALNWNWLTAIGLAPILLAVAPGQPEDYTHKMAEAFGHKFSIGSDGTLAHGVVTHIIGKFGRWQDNFHGPEFHSVNMRMFVNAPTNDYDKPQPGFWDRVWSWF